jgi:hypothetical protein
MWINFASPSCLATFSARLVLRQYLGAQSLWLMINRELDRLPLLVMPSGDLALLGART